MAERSSKLVSKQQIRHNTMAEFKSDKLKINASDSKIFEYLSDFNNFEQLMPEQVINWQSTKDNCSFTIQGMADLAMRIANKKEYHFISYGSEGKSPFPFQLNFQIESIDGGQCEVSSHLEAKLNPMLKMMASRPLQNLVNLLVEKLKTIMESES